jgi:hypothetical protein
MKKYLCLLLLPLLFAGACRTPKTVTDDPVDTDEPGLAFTTLAAGQYSGMEKEDVVLVKQDGYLTTLWNQTQSIFIPKPEKPKVDFSKKLVIGCFMGTRSNGGFRMKVEKVEMKDDILMVTLLETEPGPDCIVTTAIVNPYQFIEIDLVKAAGVEANVKLEVIECGSDDDK